MHIRTGTSYSIRTQCRLLHCAAWGIDQNVAPLLFSRTTRPKHTAIQLLYDRWRACLREYVLDRQEDIKFGYLEPVIADNDSIKFDEFEFDTTSMRRTDLDGGVVNWMDYNILYRRGHAASLCIFPRDEDHCYSARTTKKLTASQCPSSREKILKLLEGRVGNKKSLGHGDGMQALKHRPPSLQLHTQVLHSGKNKAYTKRLAFVDPNDRRRTHLTIAGIEPPVYCMFMISSSVVMP